MRNFKRNLGILLSLVFVLLAYFAFPITAEAGYTYRIKIALGNNENAYFDQEVVEQLKAKYTVEYPVTRQSDGKSINNQLIISNLAYDAKVTFDVDDLIKIDNANVDENATQYYVKGLRTSGANDVLHMTDKKEITFTVEGDETYVVAYGVGATIPYTVRYVDADGNQLLEDDTLYAAEGEIIYVPARHIDGYSPDAYYRTASKGLKKDTTFTFKYTKGTAKTIYSEEEVTVTTDETVEGSPEYEYEYQYVDGGASTIINNNGTSTSTIHETVTGNGGVTNNREVTTEGDNAGAGAGGDGNAAGNADGDGANITDNTPRDVIDIDDEDVALAGGTRDTLVRNTIIGVIIAILAVIAILVTLYIADRKRKGEIARAVEDKDSK